MSCDGSGVFSFAACLNTTQTNLLKYLPVPSAILSVAGSLLILYHVVVGKKLKTTYHRIMCGTSVVDILISLPLVVFPPLTYPITEPSAVCVADGFRNIFSYASPLYSASLSCYYLLVINYSVSDRRLSKIYEPFLHLVSILWPLSASLIVGALNSFTPYTIKFGCGIFAYPANCEEQDDIECEVEYRPWLLFYSIMGPLTFALVVLFSNNARIYCKLRRLEQANSRYAIESTDGASSDAMTLDTEGSERNQLCSNLCSCLTYKASNSKSARVAGQAVLYLVAFMGTFTFTVILLVLASADVENFQSGKYFAISALEAFLFPMQGFFNCFVFFRPRYLRWRIANLDKPRHFSLWKATLSLENPRARGKGTSTKRCVSGQESVVSRRSSHLTRDTLNQFTLTTATSQQQPEGVVI